MELFIVVAVALGYFFPSLIAFVRGHLSALAILTVNVFLGWTFLGWLVALVWAFTGNTRDNARRYSGLS